MEATRLAIYPGSFDPVTIGHLNIIERSLMVFPHLVVAVAVNSKKTPLFSVQERMQMILQAVGNRPDVSVEHFSGLLMEYARGRGARAVVRGLRAVSDFEYEFQMATMNRKLNPEVETLFMMTDEGHYYISSQTVKEVASLGGCVRGLVPACVESRLLEKYRR